MLAHLTVALTATLTMTLTVPLTVPLTGGAADVPQPRPGRLPGASASVVANLAGRPVQLTSYSTLGDRGLSAWNWAPARRAFVRGEDPVTVSPDERWEAILRRDTRAASVVRFRDRKTGRTSDVELPVPVEHTEHGDQYLDTLWPTWSPDGRRLLVNVFAPGSEPRSEGVVLIDVPSLEPRFVRIEKALITVGGFQWTRDGEGVVVRWGRNGSSSVRLYDLDGQVRRTWHVRGRPAGQGLGTFTPSGRRFVTACTALEQAACVWDTATGKAVTRIRLAFNEKWGTVLGWYDENRLLASTKDGVGVVDLRGEVVETLLKADGKENFHASFTARRPS
ncbi:hypothetical protein [Nonomuraea pusilla]|uniref:WD40-like Beta Propeller Repeat n=1 Tax=Nonomuraea pusilla TaxID=46177 RepID=A0A1H7GYL2_9ACTN|nr:hypothetical protein [Nonomuraea pusilla]SEK42597.1 hypothetical protein SAMN05660976_00519 [Nonomuraea pusilla]